MTSLRSLTLGLLAVAALMAASLVAACGGGDDGRSVSLGEAFDLDVGETIAIEQTPLRLRFERVVQDSRCPMDVTCVRAGDVTIEFTVVPDAGEPFPLEATLGDGGDGTTSVHPYRITVREVKPLPRSTVTAKPSDYTATVVVATV